jgi:hypothetical protein
MLAAMERIAYCLTTGTVVASAPMAEEQRMEGLARYSRRKLDAATPRHERQDFLFAISYAESDWEEGISRFQQDLLSEVRIRTGDADAEAFLPVKSASVESWTFEREPNLRNSRLLICLVTPAYVANARAVREVSLFTDRGKPVIPVSWVSVRGQSLPELQDLLFFQESLSPRYGTQDARDLVRLEKHADNYHDFLVQLAGRIVRSAKKPGRAQIGSEALSITFCVVASRRDEAEQLPGSSGLYGTSVEMWSPFTNGYRRPISDILHGIAADMRLPIDIVSPHALVELLDASELPADTAIVIIIDLWTLTLPYDARLLQRLSSLDPCRSARIVCVDFGGERNQERHRIREFLSSQNGSGYTYYVYDYDSLEDAVLSAVSSLSAAAWHP